MRYGLGELDLLPTKLLDTSYLETASDDWFADFDNDGVREVAIGWLPVRTMEEATRVVNKLLAYGEKPTADAALLVSDANDGFDFEQVSDSLKNRLTPIH
jgi:hypothetical protein